MLCLAGPLASCSSATCHVGNLNLDAARVGRVRRRAARRGTGSEDAKLSLLPPPIHVVITPLASSSASTRLARWAPLARLLALHQAVPGASAAGDSQIRILDVGEAARADGGRGDTHSRTHGTDSGRGDGGSGHLVIVPPEAKDAGK